MKRSFLRLLPWLLLHAGVAAIGWWLLERHHWMEMRPGLVTIMALLAGTAFIRSARGLPVTDPSSFAEAKEIEELYALVEHAIRILWTVVALNVVGALLATAMPHLMSLAGTAPQLLGVGGSELSRAASALGAAWSSAAISRLFVLYRLDKRIAKTQAAHLRHAWQSAHDENQRVQRQKTTEVLRTFPKGNSYGRSGRPTPGQ